MHNTVCGHLYFGLFFSKLEAIKGPGEEIDLQAMPQKDGQCLILLRLLLWSTIDWVAYKRQKFYFS